MASFTYPGVYIEELTSGQHTITGVATSIGAFIGWAPQGPVSAATLVQSWPDYQTQFGGLDARSWLGYAVNQFFANGGSQCYIVRLVWDGTLPGGVNGPVACATALAAGAGYGTATISATSGALSGAITLGVGTPVLQSVTVLPQGVTVPAGGSLPQLPPLFLGASLTLNAIGGYSDGSTPNLSGVTWISSDSSILAVSASGVVTAGSTAGTATISAVSSSISGSTSISGSISLAVTVATLKSISVTPATVSVVAGQTVQLAAAANYSDGTSPDITALAVWTSPDAGTPASTSAITFTSTAAHPLLPGQFYAKSATGVGGTTISAALPTVWTLPAFTTTTAGLTVTAAVITSLAISPANATVALTPQGAQTEPAAFTVTAMMSDGTTPTVPATLVSSNPAVIALPAPVAITGWSITGTVATFDTAANSFAVNEWVTLSGFSVGSFFNGQAVQVSTAGTTSFEANFTEPSGAPTEATEAGIATPDTGALSVLTAGTATITASYTPSGSSTPITASTSFTVSGGNLAGLSVTPATLTLAGGLSQQLAVTGTFSNGAFVNMTGYASWNSSNATVAAVSAAGVVTAAAGISANQSVSITATWMNISATVALTVTPPIPVSIAVTTTPAGTTSLTPGQNLSLVATATLSDNTTSLITGSALWASSAPLLAAMAGQGVVAASASAGGSLTLFAANPGIWGNNLRLNISVLPAPNSNRFNLQLLQLGANGQLSTLESYVNLSVLSSDSNYVVTVVNNDSSYMTFTNPGTGQNVIPTASPAATAAPVAFTGGADGTVLRPTDGNFELALTTESTAGYNLLDRVDIFNLLCVPGETDAATISTLQAYCAQKRAFYIVDPPQLTTIANMIQSGPENGITGVYAANSALYFPWVQAPDPLVGNRPALFPPCGFVAGIYAATDASRGVWKAPAGINASLTGNSGLQFVLTDAENGSLNPQAVNCLRQFKVYGDVVWGARTLAGNDQAGSQWKYVPIRRLALFLESSLFDGTQWVVFEPNDETLWGQVRMNVGTFLQGLFLQGAFAGSTKQQAYFVKCDAENNPPGSVALGVVNIGVGFAPLYPAEFVVIQIQQIIAQGS